MLRMCATLVRASSDQAAAITRCARLCVSVCAGVRAAYTCSTAQQREREEKRDGELRGSTEQRNRGK